MNDIRTILLGDGNEWLFLLECLLRTVVMFVAALLLMKLTGKKEVRQFSLLELLVIIGLGSALGDAMIYTDSPLLPSLVAIAVVLGCYWALNKWTNRSRKVEAMVEGEVVTVLSGGVMDLEALDGEGLSGDELFGELRVLHVEHLGQVRAAHVEINGEVSVFYLPDDEVRPGLPLAPQLLKNAVPYTALEGTGSCRRCGYTAPDKAAQAICPHCGHDRWVASAAFKRMG
jgi:uncharacterized membrane protein YcaP (DUF421 family)